MKSTTNSFDVLKPEELMKTSGGGSFYVAIEQLIEFFTQSSSDKK